MRSQQASAIQYANDYLTSVKLGDQADYLDYLEAMDEMYCDSYLANHALDKLGYRIVSDGSIISKR